MRCAGMHALAMGGKRIPGMHGACCKLPRHHLEHVHQVAMRALRASNEHSRSSAATSTIKVPCTCNCRRRRRRRAIKCDECNREHRSNNRGQGLVNVLGAAGVRGPPARSTPTLCYLQCLWRTLRAEIDPLLCPHHRRRRCHVGIHLSNTDFEGGA